jgi:Lon protease-like protein
MDILSEGRAVFHLTELLDQEEFYEGIVEYLSDEPDAPDPEKERRLLDLYARMQNAMQGEAREPIQKGGIPLAYRIAAQLPMDLPEKQRLLEMRAESGRQEFLLQWMNETLPRLLRTQRLRQLAGGNGHGVK